MNLVPDLCSVPTILCALYSVLCTLYSELELFPHLDLLWGQNVTAGDQLVGWESLVTSSTTSRARNLSTLGRNIRHRKAT